MRRSLALLLAVLVLGAGLGCTRARPPAGPRPQPSGFLGDYSRFRADPSGALVFRKPGVDFTAYRSLLLEPVALWGGAVELDVRDREHLTRYFDGAFKRSIGSAYALVLEPGPGVLRVRAALTGLVPTQRQQLEPESRSVDPHAAPIATVERSRAWAAVEAELLDAESGERLYAVVARRQARAIPSPRGLTRWGNVEEVIDVWARNFRAQLDAWHGR